MRKNFLLAPVFIIFLSLNHIAEAKLYKWVDDKGVTHYGEIIPPEYAGKQRETLTKSGLIEKKQEKPDAKELASKQAEDAKRKQEHEAEQEIKRRNSMLLNTYSNENEIDLARDRSLVLINARIDSNQTLLKSAQSSLNDLHAEESSRKKNGKPIPASLTRDITQTETRIARYQEELTRNQAELTEVKDRYTKEKELFRQLKGGTVPKQ